MAVKIRLRRMGRKKAPHYRIVVADSTAPRDGRFVESIGYYKPLESPARLVVDLDRVTYWVGQGASPSDTVKSLIEKARKGGDSAVAVGEVDAAAAREQKAAEAARKKAEVEAKAKAEAEAKAAAEADAKAKADAEAAEAAEAEAATAEAPEAPEAEAETEAESDGDEVKEG
jgi:small subunit ribosomal protein S16